MKYFYTKESKNRIYFWLTIPILILIISYSNGKKVNNKFVKNLIEYESIKNILIKNKNILNTNNAQFKSEPPYTGNKDVVIIINKKNFERDIVPNNESIKNDLAEVNTLWKKGLLGSDDFGSVILYQNNEIWFDIKFYNGGVLDFSYSHAIVYDPDDKYNYNHRSFFLVNALGNKWKYIISKQTFN